MKRDTGLIVGAAALAVVLGVSSLPKKAPSVPGGAEAAKGAPPASKELGPAKPHPPCEEIAGRLYRFLTSPQNREEPNWFPDSCYDPGHAPAKARAQAWTEVKFVIATVANPVSTHLPLEFDRAIESIQLAAQDNHYSYDDSWFPWETAKDYVLLDDQRNAEDLRKTRESQPGVIAFRDAAKEPPYSTGLIVFVVGEKPTGGISDDQFENAVKWIRQLGAPNDEVRILGPTFSGSLPSLRREIEKHPEFREVQVSSGSVSSGPAYQDFLRWIGGWGKTSYFRTAFENDLLAAERLCHYLDDQGYNIARLAFLSEDETAFGAARQGSAEFDCARAAEFSYPRDIANLRSAYQQQSILGQASPQGGATTPQTSLRGDLSEPTNGDHDTVRSYAGQMTALAQESILLDITNRLRENDIQFVVVRSTNRLDQLFLGEFLRRAYPQARVILNSADLLFTRGAEGTALRGVMALSTYPLLTLGKRWTPPLLSSDKNARTFGDDLSEGTYIAARDLFRTAAPYVPISDYAAPDWAPDSRHHPPTWLTVIGQRQFWPVAALQYSPPIGQAGSILTESEDRGDGQPIPLDQTATMDLPMPMWVLLTFCLALCALHFHLCRNVRLAHPWRAMAYFAPSPHPQHRPLIAVGSVLLAMLTLVVAVGSGLFFWRAGIRFQAWPTRLFLALFAAAGLALPLLAWNRNYRIDPLRSSTSPALPADWRRGSAIAGLVCLALFACITVYTSGLKSANLIPRYWRSVNLFSGVSPLLPQVLLIGGAVLWFWCSLRGMAHFGDDRPLLPSRDTLPELLSLFSQDDAGAAVEDAAIPLKGPYFSTLAVALAITVAACGVALKDPSLRTLGDSAFGILIFSWLCLLLGIVFADTVQIWRVWNKLRVLLERLNRLALRRTLRELRGLAWGSIWKMSGNVLDERHRMTGLELEALRHLDNALLRDGVSVSEGLARDIGNCQSTAIDFAKWFKDLHSTEAMAVSPPAVDLARLRTLQRQLADTAGRVISEILLPAWRRETESLLAVGAGPGERPSGDGVNGQPAAGSGIARYVRNAEEFVILPYLAFIQNILGRIRTIVLGVGWLFVAGALAVSSYPFDPRDVLGGIFLAAFVFVAVVMALVYSQMSRDATLSHITDTNPGELGAEFWLRMGAFGIGPLVALLATLFPSLADSVFSWLAPGAQALK